MPDKNSDLFIVVLSKIIRIMAEIDEVIGTHGAWSGTFQNGDSEAVSQ